LFYKALNFSISNSPINLYKGVGFNRLVFIFATLKQKYRTDSVAQQVEHIPFKDGVLGSNPSWITLKAAIKIIAAFLFL
jgi:hypothetical protein